MTSPRVVALGELLLRLKSPGHERLLQSGALEAAFGGAEANVLSALANDGVNTSFVTALPNNALADAAIGELRRNNIGVENVLRADGRLGTYYLEAGAGHRPGRVVYDREHSAFATVNASAFDWDAGFAGATWFHITGITPALTQSAAELCLRAVNEARQRGITVSCDYNFRGNLWRYGKRPHEVMREIVSRVQIGIAGRGDCQAMLGIVPRTQEPEGALNVDWYRDLALQTLEEFPNLELQAITLRDGSSASRYEWSGCLHNRQEFLVSQRYEISDVVDRVGAGDAFSAGLLYGLITGHNQKYALEFGVAASCLKHTIPGDMNRVKAAEVEALMGGQGGGRMQR